MMSFTPDQFQIPRIKKELIFDIKRHTGNESELPA
jgi:hypothetical protein